MNGTPKVYVVQDAPVNFLPAGKFGDVQEPVFRQEEQMMYARQAMVRRLRHAFRNFKPDDYLLSVGDPALIAVAGAIVSHTTGGIWKQLKWDRQERRYYSVDIDVFDREIDKVG